MEYAFYHPARGYWQAIDVSTELYTVVIEPERVEIAENGNETVIPAVTRETSQFAELLATYPAGTIEVPLKPGADFEWRNDEWIHVPPPALTPEEIRAAMPRLSPRQVRLGLLSIGITETAVEAALAGDDEALIEWRWATAIERLHPLVEALGVHFELPSGQIDVLWFWAAEL